MKFATQKYLVHRNNKIYRQNQRETSTVIKYGVGFYIRSVARRICRDVHYRSERW